MLDGANIDWEHKSSILQIATPMVVKVYDRPLSEHSTSRVD